MLEGYSITQKAMFEYDMNKSTEITLETFISYRVRHDVSDF